MLNHNQFILFLLILLLTSNVNGCYCTNSTINQTVVNVINNQKWEKGLFWKCSAYASTFLKRIADPDILELQASTVENPVFISFLTAELHALLLALFVSAIDLYCMKHLLCHVICICKIAPIWQIYKLELIVYLDDPLKMLCRHFS